MSMCKSLTCKLYNIQRTRNKIYDFNQTRFRQLRMRVNQHVERREILNTSINLGHLLSKCIDENVDMY